MFNRLEGKTVLGRTQAGAKLITGERVVQC